MGHRPRRKPPHHLHPHAAALETQSGVPGGLRFEGGRLIVRSGGNQRHELVEIFSRRPFVFAKSDTRLGLVKSHRDGCLAQAVSRRAPLRGRHRHPPRASNLTQCRWSVVYPWLYSIVCKAIPASAAQALKSLKILLSNDDGYRAEGLTALKAAIDPLGEVTVVAPDQKPQRREQFAHPRGADTGIAIRQRLLLRERYTDRLRTFGGLRPVFDFEHDIVVSGVNDGANLGDDTLYSGTVAAAVEGRFLGIACHRGVVMFDPRQPAQLRQRRRRGLPARAAHGERRTERSGSGAAHSQRQRSRSPRWQVARYQSDALG